MVLVLVGMRLFTRYHRVRVRVRVMKERPSVSVMPMNARMHWLPNSPAQRSVSMLWLLRRNAWEHPIEIEQLLERLWAVGCLGRVRRRDIVCPWRICDVKGRRG